MSTDMSFLTGGAKWYKSVCTLSCSFMSDSCDPIDCSLLGFSVHGILQARILKWVAISFSGNLPHPRIKPRSPALQSDSLPTQLRGKKSGSPVGDNFIGDIFWGGEKESTLCVCVCVCVRALCRSVVSDSLQPLDCSPPGSYTHGIFQARILEWIAISYSRGSSWPRDRTHIFCISRHFTTVKNLGTPK